MEEYKGKIKYYEEEIEVLFPNDYNIFRTKLSEMLGLTEEFLVNVKLYYSDEENKNKFEIKCLNDYNLFFKNLKERKDLVILQIEIKDESAQDKKKLSESISLLKSNNSLNILNNNVPKDYNIINNNIHNIDNNASINSLNNTNSNNQNYNVNINNNVNLNNIRHQDNVTKNNNNNNQAPSFTCSFPCSYCNKTPLFNIIYYCPKCNDIFCSNCELNKGPNHVHLYCKIQNKIQYNYFHLEEKLKLKKFKNKVENKVQGVFNMVNNYINNESNQNNNNINNNQKDNYVRINLVKKARSSYDLKNITDEQIKDALRKTNGNIDNAIILLTLNDK